MAVRNVKSLSRSVQKISGRVDVSGGTPSIGAGTGFSLVDIAPGQVKVVLSKPAKSILCAIAIPIEATAATGHYAKIDSKVETGGVTSVTFGIYQDDAVDAVLVDNVAFYFEITTKNVSQ